MKFIKDSFRELKHVVWPTRKETNNFFLSVVIILILFGLYLFLLATIFSYGLKYIKDLVNPAITTQTTNTTIDSIIPTSTGTISVTSSGNTSTGIVAKPVLVETNTGTISTEIVSTGTTNSTGVTN